MIKLQNIYKKYKTRRGNEITALDNINLSLPKRGLVFIVGRSGSGKSSLLNLISGIDRPDSGTISFYENSLNDFSNFEISSYRANNIGLVFQEHNLIDNFNVYQNIILGAEIQGKKVERARVENILKSLGIQNLSKRMVYELSGGEAQRVTIARALIKDPDIIIADEPTGSLNKEIGLEIINILKDISSKKLVIVVTHDLMLANKFGDRVIQLEKGKILFQEEQAPALLTDGAFVRKKTKLSFFTSLKLAFLTLKKRKKRFLLTVFLATFCLLTLGFLDSFLGFKPNVYARHYLNQMNKTYIPILKIESFQGEEKFINFDENDLDLLKEKFPNNSYFQVYSGLEEENHSIDIPSFSFCYEDDFSGAICLTEENLETLGFRILSGDLPKREEGYAIAISEYLFKVYCKFGYIDSNKNLHQVEDYNDILGKTIEVGTENYKITGIVDTKFDFERYQNLDEERYDILNGEMREIYLSDFTNLMIVNPELLKSIDNPLLTKQIIVASDSGFDDEFIDFLYDEVDGEYEYFIANEMISYLEKYEQASKTIKEYFAYLLLIIAGFCFILVYLLINESISLNIKEMAILRSMGARKRDVFKIFYLEGAMVSVLISIVGFISFIIIASLINRYLKDVYCYLINFFIIRYRQPLLFIIFSLTVCFFSTLIPILRNSRKSLVQIISSNRE